MSVVLSEAIGRDRALAKQEITLNLLLRRAAVHITTVGKQLRANDKTYKDAGKLL